MLAAVIDNSGDESAKRSVSLHRNRLVRSHNWLISKADTAVSARHGSKRAAALASLEDNVTSTGPKLRTRAAVAKDARLSERKLRRGRILPVTENPSARV